MIKNNTQRFAAQLSDAALVLLSAAADREGGMVMPAPASLRARGGALGKVVTKLLRQGLVEEVRVNSPDEAWRSDEQGSRIGLKVTEAGLNAIGVPALPEQPTADTRTSRIERKDRPAKKPGRASGARDSAESVSAGAGPDQVVAAAAKPGSKQALLIEQLGRPGGVRIGDLVSLLGWQPHTVRAALTRLRQQGCRVDRCKDEQGATIYRLGSPKPRPDGLPARKAA